MYNLIRDFPEQLLKALEIGDKAALKPQQKEDYTNILVCGLGGSGIGGNMLSELLREELRIPVIVNKGYFLPAFVGDSTLMIASSYSGNTEETISVVNQALAKGVKPVCITSGGKLEQLAIQNKLDLIKIPSGFPPRACLGYSLVQLFYVLHYYGLINDSFKESIRGTASFLSQVQQQTSEDAEFLASKMLRKVVIVYTEDKYESTALRLKQQINENSKMYCWYNVVPEMNHNELVGWREANENLAVLIFRSPDEFHRNTQRILFKKDVISAYADGTYEVEAAGADNYQKHFYLVHFGDWLSYHLAMLKGIDPVEVTVIDNLKSHLGSIQ